MIDAIDLKPGDVVVDGNYVVCILSNEKHYGIGELRTIKYLVADKIVTITCSAFTEFKCVITT